VRDFKNIIAGIDIGTSKIVTIAGTMDDSGNLVILGMSSKPINSFKRGSIHDIEEIGEAIRFTVDEVQKQIGSDIREAYIGIAGQQISCSHRTVFIIRDLTDDEISERDTKQLFEKAQKSNIPHGGEIIKIIPQSFTIDGETGIMSPHGCCGIKFELVYLQVMDRTSSTSQIRRCIEQLGISVNEMFLASVASAAAVLISDENDAIVLAADCQFELNRPEYSSSVGLLYLAFKEFQSEIDTEKEYEMNRNDI